MNKRPEEAEERGRANLCWSYPNGKFSEASGISELVIPLNGAVMSRNGMVDCLRISVLQREKVPAIFNAEFASLPRKTVTRSDFGHYMTKFKTLYSS